MKSTLETIALRTGFSASTVSRVLSGKSKDGRISEKTAGIIRKAAQEAGYTPNVLAQNLRTRKTNTIGLLVPSVGNPFFADIASSVIEEARRRGYTTIVTDSAENPETEKSAISSLLSRQVDGIIAIPSGDDPALYEEINRKVLPVILVDRYFSGSTLPYITTNNYTGSVEGTSELILNGHRRIACIQGATASMPNKKRVAGYLAALEKAGLRERAVIVGNEFSEQNGYLETKLLLSRPGEERPSAIFALSNTIMLGAVRAIKEAGLKIPGDISIIAFDNNIYMDYLTPAITRIAQPTDEMGKLATKLLFECIATGQRSTTQIELAPTLVRAASVSERI